MPIGLDESHDKVRSYLAEAALATAGVGVIPGTDQNEVLVAGANPNHIVGVVLFPALINEPVSICERGQVAVLSGAAITINDPLTTDAAGKWVTCTTGQFIHGYAMQAASAADELIIARVEGLGRATAA
jgi:hypothetical protein